MPPRPPAMARRSLHHPLQDQQSRRAAGALDPDRWRTSAPICAAGRRASSLERPVKCLRSNTGPASRLSEVALPPTATASAGWGTATTPARSRSRPGRIAKLVGRGRVGHQQTVRQLGRAHGHRGPPPHAVGRPSDHQLARSHRRRPPHPAPSAWLGQRSRRAHEGQPGLLLGAEHLDPHPSRALDRCRQFMPVAGAPDRLGRHRPHQPGAQLSSAIALAPDHLDHLGDLGRPIEPRANSSWPIRVKARS